MRRSLWLLAGVWGCDAGDADRPTDGNDTCAIIVQQAFPEDGASDVFFQTDVHFLLSAIDETATITITEASSGETVPGSTTIDGQLVTWSGDDLDASTSYDATLGYTCGEDTRSWTTSSAGEPLADPTDLIGNVYSIDLRDGHWVEPYNVGVLLGEVLSDVEILISPTSIDTLITMRGALGDGSGDQDLCAPSIPFPPAEFHNPSFTLETDRLELPLADSTAAIEDLELSGSFTPPDGDAIEGVMLAGLVDTRALVPLIQGEGDDAFCQLLDAALGVPCEECTDQTGPYCVTILVDNLTAEKVSQAGLVERTQEQIDQDPACPTG